MNRGLAYLYKLKHRLEQEFEAAASSLPEKQALDQAENLIATLESKRAPLDSGEVVPMRARKPRTLIGNAEREAMLSWLDEYYRKRGNEPARTRQLTDSMIADGIKIPGSPKTQVFVVTGMVTRNKKFKGKNGYWQLADFAA
jgi:hypothetical protein